MINTIDLERIINEYKNTCFERDMSPTYKGLALRLGICPLTIRNVNTGLYNGHRYTDNPAATRCICNDDFELIQGLYGNRSED